ncbi:hypothetical protein Purlil1_3839 [Purpureocillium lilacinum]|uniref:Secreted protein n=1 Tax=Purpureocillium lilacinum TaxID=33203 RepID=A0ABR0C704_PURLI|nr:hypothetical protein Purlil1_3839 [Purpureocillium lilacinum]
MVLILSLANNIYAHPWMEQRMDNDAKSGLMMGGPLTPSNDAWQQRLGGNAQRGSTLARFQHGTGTSTQPAGNQGHQVSRLAGVVPHVVRGVGREDAIRTEELHHCFEGRFTCVHGRSRQ